MWRIARQCRNRARNVWEARSLFVSGSRVKGTCMMYYDTLCSPPPQHTIFICMLHELSSDATVQYYVTAYMYVVGARRNVDVKCAFTNTGDGIFFCELPVRS